MGELARKFEATPKLKAVPAEKEQASPRFEKKIGKKYDTLLVEREKLRGEINKYNLRDFNIFFEGQFNKLNEKHKLIEKWLQRVRAETDFLDITDRLGIEIFKDDLAVQPNFPNFEIIFGSKEIIKENIMEERNIGGKAGRLDKPVEIMLPASNLPMQTYHFLRFGKLSTDVDYLVHELVHKYHTMHRNDISSYLTEAQAYLSGIISEGAGSVGIVSILSMPKEEEGTYGFEIEPAIEAVQTVVGLYALGVPADKIGDLIKESEEKITKEILEQVKEKKRKNFFTATDYFNKLKRKYRIKEIEQQALADIYRLHASNERLKARLLLFQVIEKNVPDAERKPREQMTKTILSAPDYKLKGKRFEAHDYLQACYYPFNKEFPYDSESVRHGIIFGFFPKEGEGVDFGIGRIEAGMEDATITLAKDETEEKKYLEILKESVKNISPESKEFFVNNYLALINPLTKPAIYKLSLKLFYALFSQEEINSYLDKIITDNEMVGLVMKKIDKDMEFERLFRQMYNYTPDDSEIIIKDFMILASLESEKSLADEAWLESHKEFIAKLGDLEHNLMPLVYLAAQQMIKDIDEDKDNYAEWQDVPKTLKQTQLLNQFFQQIGSPNLKLFADVEIRFDALTKKLQEYYGLKLENIQYFRIPPEYNGKKFTEAIKPLAAQFEELAEKLKKISGSDVWLGKINYEKALLAQSQND